MPEPGERQLDREKFGEKNKMFHSITLCLDMKGCPNRCRHCWMGWGPNGDMPEEDLAAAAADFAPFAENLELHDWDREPDGNCAAVCPAQGPTHPTLSLPASGGWSGMGAMPPGWPD